MGILSYTSPVFESVCSFVQESLRHAPSSNQSRHLVVRESFTRPFLESVSSFSGWGVCLIRPVVNYVRSFSAFTGYLTHPVLECVCSFGGSGVSVTVSEISHAEFCPVVYVQSVSSFGKWQLILNAPCWSLFVRRVGSLFYTPRAGICLIIRRMGSHSYTPYAAISLVIW